MRLSPLGQWSELGSAARSAMTQARQEQHAVTSDGEGGLTRNREPRPDLRMTDSEKRLFVAMVDFNLPAVEVVLKQLFRRGLPIGAQ